jgi:LmbE family N-acetylglucosaminyl deacetylase
MRRVAWREGLKATKLLGVKADFFLGYDNHNTTFELEKELKGKIMEIIIKTRPHIVMTYDPYARYELNGDHRVTAFATYDAATFSQHHLDFPGQVKGGLEPHLVDELWFFNSPEPNHTTGITANVSKKLECLLQYKSPMEAMIEEVQQRLKNAGLCSPVFKGSLKQQIMSLWLSGNLEGGRYVEKFKIIKPFISERVPHLSLLGLIEPDISR